MGVSFALCIAGLEIGEVYKQIFTHHSGDDATKILVKVLDALLLALVMLSFGLGIFHGSLLKSHEVTGFKVTLYWAIVLNIVVRFFGVVLTDPYNMSWSALVIPVGVLLLAGALWLLEKAHPK